MLLIVTVGSIYAADTTDSAVDSYQDDDDIELDDDFDDVGDSDDDESDYGDDDEFDEEDEESDDDESDYEDDDEFDDDEEDDEEDDDWEDDESDDDEDDFWDDDDWEDYDWDDEDLEDFDWSDYDYLEYKILAYLDRYGNCTEENWTESEEFLTEYQMYLSDPSLYTLNESAEGYQTYLKIYDSITSTFDDYNLTENETAYLKFLVMYYLNHFGNVSANYTWNESEGFANFTPPIYLTAMCIEKGFAGSQDIGEFLGSYYYLSYAPVSSLDDVNQTSADNQTDTEVPYSGDMNIFLLLLVVVIMILVAI